MKGMLRGCRRAFHSKHAIGETGLTRQTSVLPPIASGRAGFRVVYFASPGKARCFGHANFAGCRGVVAPITKHAIRTMAGTAAVSPQCRDRIDKRDGLTRIAVIGASELNDELDSVSVADQVTLAAQLKSY